MTDHTAPTIHPLHVYVAAQHVGLSDDTADRFLGTLEQYGFTLAALSPPSSEGVEAKTSESDRRMVASIASESSLEWRNEISKRLTAEAKLADTRVALHIAFVCVVIVLVIFMI